MKGKKQPRKTAARASSRGRLTLDDIASKTGVSTITVSRAFRTPNKVAPKVRERILKVAQAMGYVISRAASSLASARSMNIAVIVPSLSNTVFVDMLAGAEQVLRPKGYHLLLGVSNYSPEEEEALVRTVLHSGDYVLNDEEEATAIQKVVGISEAEARACFRREEAEAIRVVHAYEVAQKEAAVRLVKREVIDLDSE
jgi:predicted DNA-binding protein (UPF0251 family)